MKKLFSLLMAVMMMALSVAALAESPDSLVEMPDVGMQFCRFADMEVGEPDLENSLVYTAANASVVLSIYVVGTNDMTLDDMGAALAEQGYTVVANGLAEAGLAYDHLLLTYEGVDSWGGIVFQGTDGYFYDFECEALDENGAFMFGQMIGTLQPMA